jgi:hypothetical protein
MTGRKLKTEEAAVEPPLPFGLVNRNEVARDNVPNRKWHRSARVAIGVPRKGFNVLLIQESIPFGTFNDYRPW